MVLQKTAFGGNRPYSRPVLESPTPGPRTCTGLWDIWNQAAHKEYLFYITSFLFIGIWMRFYFEKSSDCLWLNLDARQGARLVTREHCGQRGRYSCDDDAMLRGRCSSKRSYVLLLYWSTTPERPVPENIVSHETDLWCKKSWGSLTSLT